ncbi:MAG: fibronectin type III domain-containing protein, partial [Bacillota bacterium]|nr:fibronectin type III domain-containing protein [Bacillota bacterium]
MKLLKRTTLFIILTAFILQLFMINPVFAALGDPPSPPLQLKVAPNHILNTSEPAIGYNQYDGNYIDIQWNAATFPAGTGYYNVYIQEIPKYGSPAAAPVLRSTEKDITATSGRLRNLKSGTEYNIYVTAYYKYTTGTGTTTASSTESAPSNIVKALTDIKIAAYTYSDSQIKIEWDDVWDSGGKRMNYKLYITDGDFSNTQPIYVGPSQIDPYGPIKINTTTGKLEYTHTVGKPATVYYVKIAPDTTDTELQRNPESNVSVASTYILATTTKMASTDFGTIWKLDWSPVLKDLSDSNVNISYLIYKGTSDSTQLPTYMSSVQNTTMYITVPPDEEDSYYIIRANVTKNGQDYFPVTIQSDKVYMKEQDVSAHPSAPEIVDNIQDSQGNVIISYDDSQHNGQLKPDSATVLLNPPTLGNGNIDSDVSYDIWLITDPNTIDKPQDNDKLETSLKMDDDKYLVKDNTTIRGYKYTINGLKPNATYYFRIIAKKTFIENKDGELTNVEYDSDPSYKIIITPTDGPIDQPMVPGRPPLKIKKSATDGRDMITTNSATIELKNLWYEKYNNTTGKWEYFDYNAQTALNNPVNFDGVNYRIVQYDQGVTYDVGVMEYTQGMTYDNLDQIPANWVTGVKITPNDNDEDPTQNADGQRHNVDINVTGLDTNKTYIIWVRAERASEGLISGSSDPIMVTTNPDLPPVTEKPIVPTFNYNLPGDTYIDLGWDIKTGYNYYIKYAKKDDVTAAEGTVKITSQDLQYANYYRIDKLDPDTLYYFWIQAEAVNGSDTVQSEWSDSYSVKTLQIIPPATPKGFGVKNIQNSVTKNTITFQWIQEDGLEYRLEIASDINYTNSKVYDAKEASEFIVSGLNSNFRYYARLYAYDPDKKLTSQPTQSVTVRTLRSSDDYDSNQDIENVISGDYVVKDPLVVNGQWNVKITGVNADRLVEVIRNGNSLDYRIDLSTPPSSAGKIVLAVSDKVFKALTGMGKSLTIVTGTVQFNIRPDMLSVAQESNLSKKYNDFNFELALYSPGTVQSSSAPNITLKTNTFAMLVNVYDGNSPIAVNTFNKPLKVVVPYTGSNWYKQGVTSAAVYDSNSSSWQKIASVNSFDSDNNSGTLSFETMNAGNMAVIDNVSNCPYLDLSYRSDSDPVKSAVMAITALHKLNSVSGTYFRPDSNATIADATKFMLDAMNVSYSSNYTSLAAKSGLISVYDNTSAVCTREKAVLMVVRLYELKTGNT